MSESTAPNAGSSEQHSAAQQEAEHNRQRAKRSGSRRGARPQENADQQRQPRARIDRAMVGFGDGIERAICQGVISAPPRSYPVQHRTGVAVIPLAVVDHHPNVVLLCDGQHGGPHIWPNGDVVGAPTLEASMFHVVRVAQSE